MNDLLKQLAVLKPANPLIFSVPGVGDLKGLKFLESFIDYRKKKMGDKEYFDTINFYLRWQGTEGMTVERDMPGAILKTREALWQYKVKFTEEEIRNARGIVERTRFAIRSEIVADVVIKADHEQARLLFSAKNLTRLGAETFDVPALAMDEPMLEELARTLMGHNSEFRKFRSAGLSR